MKFATVGASALIALTLGVLLVRRVARPPEVKFITGAVLRDESDPHKQRPIKNAVVTATTGEQQVTTKSDASGFFRLQFSPSAAFGDPVKLAFEHPDYRSIGTTKPASDSIYIIRLTPKFSGDGLPPDGPGVKISNIRVRYAVQNTTTAEVGSAAETFEIVNRGNVSCNGQTPCSPDGKWKAAISSTSLDAGAGKQFRNVRVSCIAGPCPFTRIEKDDFSKGGRIIGVAVRNWSDTVIYLLEAEVAHAMASETIRHSYPVIFGRSLNFTLPATAQGPSIEAEVDGAEIIFPLGPSLILSWADCRLETGSDRSKLYRCELKPKYRFE